MPIYPDLWSQLKTFYGWGGKHALFVRRILEFGLRFQTTLSELELDEQEMIVCRFQDLLENGTFQPMRYQQFSVMWKRLKGQVVSRLIEDSKSGKRLGYITEKLLGSVQLAGGNVVNAIFLDQKLTEIRNKDGEFYQMIVGVLMGETRQEMANRMGLTVGQFNYRFEKKMTTFLEECGLEWNDVFEKQDKESETSKILDIVFETLQGFYKQDKVLEFKSNLVQLRKTNPEQFKMILGVFTGETTEEMARRMDLSPGKFVRGITAFLKEQGLALNDVFHPSGRKKKPLSEDVPETPSEG